MSKNMGDNSAICTELYIQDGIQLKSAQAAYLQYINLVGTIYVTEYAYSDSDCKKYLEWKPNEVTVDSDVQEQEWALVNTVQKRSRTLSESLPPDSCTRSKFLKINLNDIRSFKTSNKYRQLTLFDGKSEMMSCFLFLETNSDALTCKLKELLPTAPSKRDKHLFIIINEDNAEAAQLNKSFAELNLFQDGSSSLWKYVKNLHDRPYETTFETFARVTDLGELPL